MEKIKCKQCDSTFERRKDRVNKKGNNFCSKSCAITFRNLAKTNGRVIHKKGYIRIYVGHEHPSNSNGYVFEHRLVMEEAVGRPLHSHEIVHHKNGIKDDNRIENLELLTTKNHLPTYDNEILDLLNKTLQENIKLKKELKSLQG